MSESLLIKTAEFPIGLEVPIKEHSNRSGTSCPGRIGKVKRLDDFNKPLEATCILSGCGKKATIDWVQIQLNRQAR